MLGCLYTFAFFGGKLKNSTAFRSKIDDPPSKNTGLARAGLTKIMFSRSRDLQKSGSREIRTYKNHVWAKSGLIKKTVWANLGLTKTRFGRSRDIQK